MQIYKPQNLTNNTNFMKYNVSLSYHGSLTVKIEADNGQAALEAARAKVGAMSDTDFNNAIELMEESHDVEEVEPDVNEGWKKPRFTAEDVLKDAHYEEEPWLKDINDSMEIDSDPVDLAYLKNTIITRSCRKLTVDASVRAVGDVKVYFKGNCYRNASKMPKELIQCYHDGTDPVELDPDYDCCNNNWFEEFFRVTGEDGTVIFDDSFVIDDPAGKESLAESIADILNDEQKCLGMLFKEDDQVRWDDPDKSVSDQMNPDELKEYRQRVFRIVAKGEESVSISDGYTDAEVPYSELLLEEA